MKISEARTQIEKTMPQWMPQPVKNRPLASATTIIGTVAGVIAIVSWLGFQPPQVLADDQAYVTHQQFNLLTVQLIEALKDLETEVEGLKRRPIVMTPSANAAVSDTPTVTVAPTSVMTEAAPTGIESLTENLKGRLGKVYDEVQHLQMEQRTK